MPECLYCRQTPRKFTSVEHVIPESLGNTDSAYNRAIVLPKGAVCDHCNNGALSQLDQALIRFDAISWMKTSHGIPSKSGALPSSTFNNAKLSMPAPGQLLFESNSKKTFRPDGKGNFKINFRGSQRMTPGYARKLTRALFKMTMGCMYIDNPQLAMSDRFDPVRRMVLGLDKFHGYLTLLKKATLPTAQEPICDLQYIPVENSAGEQTILTQFRYFGVEMGTDLEVRKLDRLSPVPDRLLAVVEF